MFVKGYISLAEKVSGDLALKHARFALEQSQSQKKVLVDFTRERTTKALTGAIELARARELAAQGVLERERALQKKLASQVERLQRQGPGRRPGRIRGTRRRRCGRPGRPIDLQRGRRRGGESPNGITTIRE